jgi:hypothetical protein
MVLVFIPQAYAALWAGEGESSPLPSDGVQGEHNDSAGGPGPAW